MAIETTIQLSENKYIQSAYIKINTPRSYKILDTLKLGYDIEQYSEKGGILIGMSHRAETDYNGGDIWLEAYTHLKTTYKDSKDL